jgi:regulator of sigma E protease
VPWDAGWSDNEEEPVGWASPMSVPQLGLAYLVETLVAQVEPGSPAAAAGLQPLDRIDKVRVRRVGKTAGELSWGKWNELSSRRPGNPEAYDQWAHLFWALQQLDSPQVQLQVTRNGAALAEPIELTARPDLTWPLDERGLILSPDTRLQQAHGVGEALAFGVGDTVRFIKQIYLNLRGLVTGRISYKSLGGPVEIARQAFASADNLWRLVLFLGIISVNLAVVNFLPIPVLDGGHMVFLIYEKLLGRPPSEAVRAAATYVGLALLGSLMLFVFYLDIKRLLGA